MFNCVQNDSFMPKYGANSVVLVIQSDITKANLLELKGDNPSKSRAYRRAADILETLDREDVAERARSGQLKKINVIGVAIEDKGLEILDTGNRRVREDLRA